MSRTEKVLAQNLSWVAPYFLTDGGALLSVRCTEKGVYVRVGRRDGTVVRRRYRLDQMVTVVYP